MKLSVRKGTCDGRGALFAYRKRERTHTRGTAYETPRGMWITYVTGKPAEAFHLEADARAYLESADEQQGGSR